MTIRILVADDHPIFRDGLVRSLEETGEFRVVATASTADEAVTLADQKRPDVALLDLSMPGNGLNAVKAISWGMDKPMRLWCMWVKDTSSSSTGSRSAWSRRSGKSRSAELL